MQDARRGDASPPLIGLTGRRVPAMVLGVPHGWADAPIDAYFSEYAQSVTASGGLPVHTPLTADPHDLAARCDGFVFSGGEDVDPVRYSGTITPATTVVDPRRDEFEIALFEAAVALRKPVLGICRGAQLINVARGGTLVSDLLIGEGSSHASYAYPRTHRRHTVHFAEDTIGHRLYGRHTWVNSFHHQAVDRPGRGIVVSGHADDGVAEAIELDGAPVLGLQWHPECFNTDPAFGWLVDACRTDPAVHQNSDRQDAA